VRLIWLAGALRDLEHALDYVGERNPNAARRMGERIVGSVGHLVDFPRMGRPGRAAGTYELVIARTPYIVAYQLADNDIEVLAVIHGARRWPDSL
jgi:plasmid stabilization system protein ParE